MFCVDLEMDRTLAAVSLHVDAHRSAPPLIIDVLVREDEHAVWGAFGFWMLMDVLQDVAYVMPGRCDGEVGLWGQNDAECRRSDSLGLQPCAAPPHLVHRGTWHRHRRTRPRIPTAESLRREAIRTLRRGP